ncbi:MAG: hypothetical protein SVR94_08735, partial [Pseudomonadota bacterium]|nr:hypothetical protein [Pseudomonadota bacterium]
MIFVLVHYPYRELESKVLLAYKLANKFGNVIIGNAAEIRNMYANNIFAQADEDHDVFFEIAA